MTWRESNRTWRREVQPCQMEVRMHGGRCFPSLSFSCGAIYKDSIEKNADRDSRVRLQNIGVVGLALHTGMQPYDPA